LNREIFNDIFEAREKINNWILTDYTVHLDTKYQRKYRKRAENKRFFNPNIGDVQNLGHPTLFYLLIEIFA